ncbi:hypothetical protein PsorP6_006927 [Peronosclerospora sorghi]|uniref:Uncharacterized protein n=1 Tax=Peronosclerospora sorghi TaxID=230839 RepID=A0ACC0WB80_9STRA|nr:hypothetical protein PsorP6_006927 [Peronosclerospora sorghi]
MTGDRSCRHVGQSVRATEFRRELKKRSQLLCEACPTPDDVSAARESWATYATNENLVLCVSCAFIGCFRAGHFHRHVETHAKHALGFQVASQRFYCAPCQQDVPLTSRARVEKARVDVAHVLDEVASKKYRQLRHPRRVSPTSTRTELATREEAATSDPPDEVSMEQPTTHDDDDDKLVVVGTTPLRLKARDEKGRRRHGRTTAAETLVSSPIARASGGTIVPSSVVGFTNVGNTCYFNASIQALLTAAHFSPDYLHAHEVFETTDSPILTTFTMLHETIKKRARKDVASGKKAGDKDTSGRSRAGSSPVLTVAPLLKEMRKKCAQFRGTDQQDAHELFLSFLWAIDEEVDPPIPPVPEDHKSGKQPAACDYVTSSSCSTATSSELLDDEESGTWHLDDGLTETEPTETTGVAPVAAHEQERDVDTVDREDTKQVFVRTDTGETIAMQVPTSATVKDVRHLLAKRLHLNEDDMLLEAAAVHSRASLSSRPSTVRHARAAKRKTYSSLNFTRHLFGGALTTVVVCKACANRTEIVEDAFHLSVAVPDRPDPTWHLTDCLNTLVAETHLLVDTKSGYDCDQCSRQPKAQSAAVRFLRTKCLKSSPKPDMEICLRDASMHVVVSTLPRVLVVHLKRLGRARKLTHHVAFPEKLDMTRYVSETLRQGRGEACPNQQHELEYQLIAVIVHKGTRRSGHYVAYVSRSRRREARLLQRGRTSSLATTDDGSGLSTRNETLPSRLWYYVSDTLVKRVSLDHVLQCEAYMLFYQRRSRASVGKKATGTTSPRPDTSAL